MDWKVCGSCWLLRAAWKPCYLFTRALVTETCSPTEVDDDWIIRPEKEVPF